MTYTVKEIYRTIQGEGALAGRVAVFCRFAGCNLWSGRESGRDDAVCKFCDTDFVGGEHYNGAEKLGDVIEATWGRSIVSGRMVVLTGGEPALQYNKELHAELRKRLFFIAIETNGTVELAANADWVCVSPKANTEIVQKACNELKVVYPQKYLDPEKIMAWPTIKSIQPMDGPDREKNIQLAIEYCMAHPDWKLSLQTHKMVGLR